MSLRDTLMQGHLRQTATPEQPIIARRLEHLKHPASCTVSGVWSFHNETRLADLISFRDQCREKENGRFEASITQAEHPNGYAEITYTYLLRPGECKTAFLGRMLLKLKERFGSNFVPAKSTARFPTY